MIRRILLPLNTLRSSRRRTESLLLLSLSFLSFNETLAVSLFFFASVARFCASISVVAGKDLQKEKRKD
jgi:hypothetical protein|tara:strand:- start:4118 stop:4324 length:207 start_codon:yes stop_codon:yes gene_type:complete